jgi:Putative Flp pilus-assembly TadE/G-like
MKEPAIRKFSRIPPTRHAERGITMVLVALAMVAIIAMAALSIDVVTLYLAKEEAQRSADAGALAAARVISISGVTGTAGPDNDAVSWQKICGPDDGTNGLATRVAKAVAGENAVGRISPTVSVTYSSGSGSTFTDCTAVPGDDLLGVNPLVTVQVTRNSLPTFFSRVWSRAANTVSATATAEVFNPSNSGAFASGGNIIPVQPRCVKPWIVPNRDPLNPGPTGNYCDESGGPGACHTLVKTSDGSITNKGISLNGGNPTTGLVGERFWLIVDCHYSGSSCSLRGQIQANRPQGGNPHIEFPPSLDYVPGQTQFASVAVPSGSVGTSLYQRAVAGCDQTTQYKCGVQQSNEIDLSENPGGSGDTPEGVQNRINQSGTGGGQPNGQDYLNNPYGPPTSYPFHILAGTSNPLVVKSGLPSGTFVTSSTSVVSLPIYDDSAGLINASGTTRITIIGFLQVFINEVDQWGNVNVTVLNVAGCSNGNGPDSVSSTPVTGSSPVPIRLITPP